MSIAIRRRTGPAEVSKKSVFYLILLTYFAMSAFPFVWSALSSFKTLGDATAHPLLPTQALTISAWKDVLGICSPGDTLCQATKGHFPRFFLNSVIVAGLVTIANLFFDSLAGYAFARMKFPGKNVLFWIIVGTTMVPAAMTIVPVYIVLAKIPTGSWVGTYQGLVVPGMVTAFGIFLMRQFFAALPLELEEAARLDGLGRFGIYRRIAMPLAKPALATLGILTFQGNWDNFLFPLFISGGNVNMFTLPVGLSSYNFTYQSYLPQTMAGSMVVIIPVLLLYIFTQRYFVEGLSRTGLKG